MIGSPQAGVAEEPFVTVVTGAPRCGSSLTMQILFHGGLSPVAETRDVAFESSKVNRAMQTGDWSWLAEETGKAVKILEPLYVLDSLTKMPAPTKFLLLKRDPVQQARSFAKFNRLVMNGEGGDLDKAVDKLAESFVADYPKMEAMLKRLGPTYVVQFEDLLAAPETQARRMAVLLQLPRLDVASMARQVIRRSPECLPYMLEEKILAHRERGFPGLPTAI